MEVMLALLDVFRTECALIDLENPTKSGRGKEIDKLTFLEYCTQQAQTEDAIGIANLLSTCLVGVESDEVSALYMLLYFKSAAGIDNIISDQKDGGQYLRNRECKDICEKIMAACVDKTRKPNNLPKDGTGAWSGLRLSPHAGHIYRPVAG
jgi:monoamine oxidase